MKPEKLTAEQADARKMLAKLCPVGTTVHTVIRHVARSGMSRRIDLYVIHKNRLACLSHYIAILEGYRVHKSGGLTVQGCGMDMGFHLVHNLSYALHGYEKTSRVSHPGYTLTHEWI